MTFGINKTISIDALELNLIWTIMFVWRIFWKYIPLCESLFNKSLHRTVPITNLFYYSRQSTIFPAECLEYFLTDSNGLSIQYIESYPHTPSHNYNSAGLIPQDGHLYMFIYLDANIYATFVVECSRYILDCCWCSVLVFDFPV